MLETLELILGSSISSTNRFLLLTSVPKMFCNDPLLKELKLRFHELQKMCTIFVSMTGPNFVPPVSRECIFFSLSINSSVSVWQTWFCNDEIVWLNFLPRYKITEHGDLTVQGHVIECFHISAEPVSGSLCQSRSTYQRSVLHLLLRSSSTLGLYFAHDPMDSLVPQILSTRIVNTRGNF